jgi:hypothetical protein
MELCETDVQKFLDREHGNVLSLYDNSIMELCKGTFGDDSWDYCLYFCCCIVDGLNFRVIIVFFFFCIFFCSSFVL